MIKNKINKRVIEQIKDPVDSSMMFGAFRAVDGIKDIYPFYIAPSGCPFHIAIMWERHNRGPEKGGRGLQTMLYQSDLVMGFNAKLEEDLNTTVTVVPDYAKAILVISSDAAEIVLPDVDRITAKVEEETDHKIKIIPVHAAGLKGNHLDGINLAMLKVLQHFFKEPQKTKPKSVNLLGLIQDEIGTRADVVEVKRLLNAIGISVISTMFVDSSTEEIAEAGAAECNIVLHEEYGLQAAKYLEKKFGIPYICESPPFGFEDFIDVGAAAP